MLPESSAYVEAYGIVQPQDNNYLERTHGIFNKLKRISGRASQSAKLLVINSPDKPWAIALADGNVVLSAGSLNIVYGENDLETGDAWMAFVLGHELAHLANRDMWHHQMHQALAGDLSDQTLKMLRDSLSESSLNLENIKDRELKADEQGFMYAALAGYKTNRILRTTENQDGFLSHWVKQTHTVVDNSHHTAELRTRFLNRRLNELGERVRLFDYGVKLAHFGRYEDATYLVEGFSKKYPSKQSLNNSAYIKIQLARKLMQPGAAYRFWVPTLLEGDSGLIVDRGIRAELPEQARRFLLDAVDLLNIATSMDETDLVSRINLIAAHFYLGKFFHARAVVEDALKSKPKSLQLQGLRAIILLEQEPDIDMWPIVNQQLAKIADTPSAPENVVFNYARLLMERNRHGRAKKYLNKLLDERKNIPAVYRDIICKQVLGTNECGVNNAIEKSSRVPWKLPIEIGSDIESPESRKALAGWHHQRLGLGAIAFDFYHNETGDSVLAIDYSVELITLKPSKTKSTFEMMLEVGGPDVVLPHSDKEIWSFGSVWSALVSDSQVEELWIAR